MRERHSIGAELGNTLKQARSPLPIIFRVDTIRLTNCESTLARFCSLTCRKWVGARIRSVEISVHWHLRSRRGVKEIRFVLCALNFMSLSLGQRCSRL